MGKYRKLIAIVSGSSVPALTPGESGALPGFVWLDFLEAQSEPKDKGNVHLLPTPTPIKAGELIGHIGQYQNYDEAAPRALLHLEVFSCDDVPTFISKSRARAASLPDSEKTLLQVRPNTKLVTHTASMTAANPPKVSDPGSTIGVTRSIPLAVLNNLPAERKIQTSTPMTGGPAVITNWWHLDNAFADAQGNLISGWLADIIPTRHSPWEWQGFDFISETTSASEQLANHLAGQCLLSEAELPDYQMHISTADNGPIKTRLYDIIDGADGTAHNEKLSIAEIRAALGKPWHAQSISQLISQYESEWFWSASKWDELDKLMEHTPATPNTDWVAEKARIKTLSWWDQVAGQHGIKAGGMAWHFHVAGLVGCFSTINTLAITHAQLKLIFPTADDDDISTVLNEINNRLTEFKLDTRLRQRHFFAQIKGEVGPSMKGVTEGWEYSPAALKSFSSYYRAHPAEAEEDGYLKNAQERIVRRANQQEIGRKHFQKLNGNRVSHPDDGYNLRGRGLIQITGYDKYHGFMADYAKYWTDAIPDTVTNPDIINEGSTAIRSALWYWLAYKVYERELGNGNLDVEIVRKRVNGGQEGLEKRKAAYELTERTLT